MLKLWLTAENFALVLQILPADLPHFTVTSNCANCLKLPEGHLQKASDLLKVEPHTLRMNVLVSYTIKPLKETTKIVEINNLYSQCQNVPRMKTNLDIICPSQIL